MAHLTQYSDEGPLENYFLVDAAEAGWELQVFIDGSIEQALKCSPREAVIEELSYWDNDEETL
jgi:hypothetical protein